jgi:O-antigen/teichoic acid export membrane protein
LVFSQKIKNHFGNDIHLLELLKGGGATFLMKIFGMGFGYLLAILITNNYGAQFFGQYVTALLVLEILSIVSRLGVDTSVIRLLSSFVVKNETAKIHKLYLRSSLILLLSSSIFALFTFLFSDDIAQLLNASSSHLKLISYVVVPIVLYYLNAQSLRGLKKIAAFSFLNNVALVLGTLILVLTGDAIFNSQKLPVFAYVSSVVLMTILSFFLWYKYSRHYKLDLDEKIISSKELVKMSIPLLLGQSMMLIMGKIDVLMLGAIIDQESVGIYNAALKVSMLAYVGLMAINSIAAPKFAELNESGNFKALKSLVQKSTKTIFWITFPVVLIFALFPSQILSIFGEEFKIASYSLIILSIGKMFSAICGSVGTLLQMSGNQKYFQNVLIAAAILNVALNNILIPNYQLLGAAIASLVSNVFWNILMVIYIKRKFGFYTIYLPFLTR